MSCLAPKWLSPRHTPEMTCFDGRNTQFTIIMLNMFRRGRYIWQNDWVNGINWKSLSEMLQFLRNWLTPKRQVQLLVSKNIKGDDIKRTEDLRCFRKSLESERKSLQKKEHHKGSPMESYLKSNKKRAKVQMKVTVSSRNLKGWVKSRLFQFSRDNFHLELYCPPLSFWSHSFFSLLLSWESSWSQIQRLVRKTTENQSRSLFLVAFALFPNSFMFPSFLWFPSFFSETREEFFWRLPFLVF